MKSYPVIKPVRQTVKPVITGLVVSMKRGLLAAFILLCFCLGGSAQVRFGDNLGNHKATDTLRMQGHPVTGASRVTTDSLQVKVITDSLRVEGSKVRLTAIGNGGTSHDSLLVLDSNGLVKKYNMSNVGGGAAGLDTFTSNLVVYGTSFGKYTSGQTIPSQGKTAKQVIADAIVQSVAAAYVAPSLLLTSTPSAPATTTVEIGSTISISLTGTYTANDGGASIPPIVYKKNGVALAANTDNNVVITASTAYTASVGYAAGACKPNNLGVLDCTGQILANTVTSNSITYTPDYKRYVGWVSDTTGISTAGFDVTITGLTPLVSDLSSSKAFSFSTGSATGKFLVFCYVAKAGAFSNLTINGVGSLNAFNTTTRSFTNAKGYSYNAILYWNTQAQTTTGYAIASN